MATERLEVRDNGKTLYRGPRRRALRVAWAHPPLGGPHRRTGHQAEDLRTPPDARPGTRPWCAPCRGVRGCSDHSWPQCQRRLAARHRRLPGRPRRLARLTASPVFLANDRHDLAIVRARTAAQCVFHMRRTGSSSLVLWSTNSPLHRRQYRRRHVLRRLGRPPRRGHGRNREPGRVTGSVRSQCTRVSHSLARGR